jgi:MFS family permease
VDDQCETSDATETAEAVPPPRPSALEMTLRAFRHRNFRLFFIGQLVSLVGTWMQSVAQAWLVYRLTGSSILLGLVGFAGQFPVFLFAPLGGSLADTRRRQPIIITAQATMMLLAFILAGLTLSGAVRLWHVVALSALLGVVNAFEIPARQSFLVDLVGREDLMNAIALNSMMFNGSRIVGPAVAGLLVAAIGEGWCFFVNGLSFLAVLGGLLAMRLEPRPPTPPSGRSTLHHMAEGFAFVATTAPIRALLLLLGLISLAGMPYSILMPIIADRVLHGGPLGMGVLMGASGIGALLGALTLASRQGVTGLGRWAAVGSFGFGLSLIAFSLSRTFWLSAALMVPAGYLLMVQMAASNTLIQSMVPDQLRGRVMAVYSMMIMGMAPLGALLAGFLATTITAPGTVAAGGVACALGGAVFALRLPALRTEGRALVAEQEAAHAP